MNDYHLDPPETPDDPVEIAFDTWWEEEGSGLRPAISEDMEEFALRITQIAWMNGTDVAYRVVTENRERDDSLAEWIEQVDEVGNRCLECGEPTDCVYCSRACAVKNPCHHGNPPGECDPCAHNAELAADAARECR